MADAVAAYRRTGADLPWGDPVAPHGVPMEGWFWRVSDPARGRVLVVLCGACRGPAGVWTLVTLAAAPGGFMRTVICPPAAIDRTGRSIAIPDGALRATPESLSVNLGDDACLDIDIANQTGWPARPFGGLGAGGVMPGLGQYWHPHLLGARITGTARVGDDRWNLDGASAYAEKNWGAGFPTSWWWGQAHGFEDPGVCVAFAGGEVKLGPVPLAPTTVVVRTRDAVLQMSLPHANVAARADAGEWSLRGRSARYRVTIEGDGNGTSPHHLPVPVPGERRVMDGATQHFAGRLNLKVERGRRTLFAGESRIAALERGKRV